MFLRQFVRAQVWMTERRTRLLEDRGATAVEYALMLALIAMVIFAAVMFLGSAADGQFESVGDCFPPATC
jgi:pilus assembly protein Flp/PilA